MDSYSVPNSRWVVVTVCCLVTAIGWLALLPPLALLAFHAGNALIDMGEAFCAGGQDFHLGGAIVRGTSAFWFAGMRTAMIAAIAVMTAMLFALPASFILAKTGSTMNGAGWFVTLALAGIPLYVIVSGVIRMFSLAWLIDPLSPWKSIIATGLINGIGHAPLATIVASVAWLSIPRENEETGLLFAKPTAVWRKITFPLGIGGLSAAGTLVGVLSASDMTAPDALTVRTWAEELYLAFNLELDPRQAVLSAIPLIVVSMAGMGMLLWRGGKFSASILSNQGRPFYRYNLGRLRVPAYIVLTSAALATLWPLLDLLWAGIVEAHSPQAWSEIGRVSFTTILCSGIGSGLAVFLAFPLAWMTSQIRSRLFRFFAAGTVLFFLSLPTPLYGYAIASFWNQPWWNTPVISWVPQFFYDSPAAAIVLYATQTLPLAMLMLWVAIKRIPAFCLDAAKTLSIGRLSIITRVVLPLCRNGCLLAWAVCYLLSLRELGGLLLIAPPGWLFMAVRYATQVHFGIYADLAFLLAASLPLVLLPPMALIYYVSRISNQ